MLCVLPVGGSHGRILSREVHHEFVTKMQRCQGNFATPRVIEESSPQEKCLREQGLHRSGRKRERKK